MEIIIHDKEAYQHSLDENSVLWKLFVRRNRRSYIIQYGVGVLFLVFGLFPTSDSAVKTENANNITRQNETRYDKESNSIPIVVGIVWIVLVSSSLVRLRKLKESLMDEAGYRGRIVYQSSNESTTSINEERIRYENPVTKSEWKWAAFLTFNLYKDWIILNYDRTGRSSFVIEKKLLSAELYDTLLNFMRQKLTETKV